MKRESGGLVRSVTTSVIGDITSHVIANGRLSIFGQIRNGTVYIAHRGGALRYPENTDEAFTAANAAGYKMLECDVRALSDGALGVFHSATIDDLTTGTGNVVDQNTAAFEALTIDAGTWFGGGYGNLSPIMFSDFLDNHVANGNIVFPELKYPASGDTEAYGNAAVAALNASGVPSRQCLVQCFSLTPLGPIVDAGYQACIIEDTVTSQTISTVEAAGVDYAAIARTLSDSRIGEWVSSSLHTFVWTINRRVDRDYYLALGVDGLITDDPEYLEADAPFSTSDNFSAQVWQPGMIAYNDTVGNTINTIKEEARGRFVSPDQWGYPSEASNLWRGCLMGHMCPVASDPANNEWLLDFKCEFGTVDNADQTRWIAVAVHATDQAFTDGDQSGTFTDHVDAYAFLVRKDGGLAIYRRPFSGATLLVADLQNPAAISDDEEVRFQAEVNETKLTLRRLDGGGSTVNEIVSYDVDPGSYRGGYFHLGHNRVPALFRDVSVGASTAYNLWTPAQVGPYFWLGDDSPKYLSGSDITQWSDYAGNSTLRSFTESTNPPSLNAANLNGLDTVTFNGTAETLDGPSSVFGVHRNIDYAWVFAVYYLDSTTNTDRPIFISTVNGGAGSRVYLSAGSGSGQFAQIGGRRLDADSFYGTTSSTERDNQWVMVLGVMDYGAREITLYIDGEQDSQATSQFTASGSTSDTDSAGVRAGSNDAVNRWFSGDLACVLSGNSTGGADELSSDDIDKLFGWAAHRYGLAANLDAGHPYKSAAPTA